MLVDVVRGAENKRIFENKLNELPSYGIYEELPKDTIRIIIEWLIREHYILKTKGTYPVLHSTYEGLHYMESMTENKLKKLKGYLEER